jgi:HD domain
MLGIERVVTELPRVDGRFVDTWQAQLVAIWLSSLPERHCGRRKDSDTGGWDATACTSVDRVTRLTQRFDDAVEYTRVHHEQQLRKGTEIPYVAHLLAVSALVLEDDGTEDEAIAALLHDVVEDGGGPEALEEIRERFGEHVAAIVDGCSDSDEDPKPPWQERKRAYIDHLRTADESVLRVSLADKLHNSRSITEDLRRIGDELWTRFRPGSAPAQLWYYRSVADVMLERRPGARADELDREVCEMAVLGTHAPPDGPIRLWVDREPPPADEGWLQVTTAWEARALLATGRVSELSLADSFGHDRWYGRGVDVADWLLERERIGRPAWPDAIAFPTANGQAMATLADRFPPGAGDP